MLVRKCSVSGWGDNTSVCPVGTVLSTEAEPTYRFRMLDNAAGVYFPLNADLGVGSYYEVDADGMSLPYTHRNNIPKEQWR